MPDRGVLLQLSGAEANEGGHQARAEVLQRQGHERALRHHYRMQKSFHGRTLATLAATGQDQVSAPASTPYPRASVTVPFDDVEALEGRRYPGGGRHHAGAHPGRGRGQHARRAGYLQRSGSSATRKASCWCWTRCRRAWRRTGRLFAHRARRHHARHHDPGQGPGQRFPVGAVVAEADDRPGARSRRHTHRPLAAIPLAMAASLATLDDHAQGQDRDAGLREGRHTSMQGFRALKKDHPALKDVRGKGPHGGRRASMPTFPS
ncbi:MAG: hypothetical protein MZV70_73220 [Desulfobacterales bacterium]|nr:hypothetical protein [Desulfobacterales bacterium]